MGNGDFAALIESLLQSFKTGWYGFGEKCVEFEKTFAKFLGTKHAAFVNSGSSANLLAIATLVASGRVKRGDTAITTACTFPTTLNPLLLFGLKPIFVDVDLPSWSVNLGALQEAAESGARLVVLPHLNGIPSDMDIVCKIVRTNSIVLVEDACDALGSRFGERRVGTFGDMGTFSFYASHHMTTGEGGMVATDNNTLSDVVVSLRDWGRASKTSTDEIQNKRPINYQTLAKSLPDDYETRYTYTQIGFNLKPLELQGAWGLSQLAQVETLIGKRKQNFEKLFGFLKDYEDYFILPKPKPKADVSWFWFPLIVRGDAPFKRREIVEFMEKAGIETRPVLAGDILKQPAYRNIQYETKGQLTNTETIMRQGFVIGVHPKLTDSQIAHMTSSFHSFLENRRKSTR